MTIHSGHPFATPEPDRDPVRRWRGRLASGVTVWAAGSGTERAGLTVSSLMVAPGETPQLLALLDPDSDLVEALERTGRAVVQILGWEHRQLAGMFAGTDPAPGGPFGFGEFTDTEYGPLLSGTDAVGVRLQETRPVGWSVEVLVRIEQTWLAGDDEPLVHLRGRWRRAL